MILIMKVLVILVKVMMVINDGVIDNVLTFFNLFRCLRYFLIQNVFFTPVHFILIRVSVLWLYYNKTPLFGVFYCPCSILPGSLLEKDEKLCESIILTVVNECTRHGIERNEAIRYEKLSIQYILSLVNPYATLVLV